MKIYTWTDGTTVLDLSDDIQVPMRTKRVVPLEEMGDFSEEKSDVGDKPGHPFHGNQYEDAEHGEKPGDVVGPKKKTYPAPPKQPSSYWPHKLTKEEQEEDQKQGQLSFGMTGLAPKKEGKAPKKVGGGATSSDVYKPYLRKLPDVGTAFFPDKPDDSIKEINGIPFTTPDPEYWKDVPDQQFENEPDEIPQPTEKEEHYYEDEDGVTQVKTTYYQKKKASGAVIREPDGRIWLVEPMNHWAGYDATYPKGGLEPDLTVQQNALKEVYEESGLQVDLKGFLFDMEGPDSVTRYYLAERTGGNPYLAGEETFSDRLVTLDEAGQMVNRSRDKKILEELKHRFGPEAKSEAEAYIVSPEVAAPDGYFDDKVPEPKLPYDYGEDVEAEPLAGLELIPLGLYFGHIVRFTPVRAPLLTNEDPNAVAAAAAQEELGTDDVVVTSWRPDGDDGEIFTYAVILSKPANEISKPNFPITPISNIALMELDDNAVALDAIEKLTNMAYANAEFRNSLPEGWFGALKEFLPLGGREDNVSNKFGGDDAGDYFGRGNRNGSYSGSN